MAATHAERRALLATCVAAAVRGADVIRSFGRQRSSLEWEEKARADFVSAVDRASEEAISEVVRARHPDAGIVGEELTPELGAPSGVTFVADPLDGTTNYLHDFPAYCVSIAALVDGEPVAGAILNVPTGELFTATAGGGARRSGQPIAVSRIDAPRRSLIGTGFPFRNAEDVDSYLRVMAAVMREVAGIRRPGSAALDLADVACGRFDAFWELWLAPWDVAAGILLVREAGGVVTDLQGEPARVAYGPIVAGNPAMHAWLLGKVREAD
ncbi:MAG: inositol monophosphatase [Gemmatimonadota bacterium]|nr:inositol monophosphatase [Gemmatimonadota bacterium]